MVSNAQTNEEYVDEAAMIPKNTSVLVRRVPGRPRKTIVTEQEESKITEDKLEDLLPPSSMLIGDTSTIRYPEESEWDEFGNDLYAIPEVTPAQTSNPVADISPANKVDEESKIKALVDTSAFDWNCQTHETFVGGRGFGRGTGGRMMGGRGFARGGLERRTPPAGYVCHRCKIPGHFIQYCPTNGDPNYDVRRPKPPTGIPRSMLVANPDGSYALPSGAVAVLKPNEAAFEKEIEGLPTTRSVSDLPPELRCPLCKDVMKDAVLTSKCCFNSFCDKCIRDFIITKAMCVCGATNMLADDLLPNKTLRETISRILESTTSSTENVGSLIQVPDMESAHPVQRRAQSPTLSVASKEEPKQPSVDPSRRVMEEEGASEAKASNTEMNPSENKSTVADEKSTESMTKKPGLTENAPMAEDRQEKHPALEQGRRKKKKKRISGNVLGNAASDMQWAPYQDIRHESFAGLPLAAAGYNQYWAGGMQLGMDGYMAPIGGPMPYMGYTPNPFDYTFCGGLLPPDPFLAQGYMMPGVPRDRSDFGMSSMTMYQGQSLIRREEFEARKADVRRSREMEWSNERKKEHFKDREPRREATGDYDISSMKSKPKVMSRADRIEPNGPEKAKRVDRHSPSRDSAEHSPQRPSKRRRPDCDERPPPDDGEAAKADWKLKGSVFSRIRLTDSAKSGEAGVKKRKSSSSSDLPPKNGLKEHRESGGHKSVESAERHYNEWRSGGKSSSAGGRRDGGHVEYEDESSEEHHFKRRPSSSSRREAAEAQPSRLPRERELLERGGREHGYRHVHERHSSKRK